MRKAVLFLLLLKSAFSFCQTAVDSFWRYTDFHIHPTYKNYFRYKKYDPINDLISGTSFDTSSNSYKFTPSLIKKYGNQTNWKPYSEAHKKKNLKQLKLGEISNLRNYDQASYSEIMFVPGSLLIDSYSPYEKQFAYGFVKRLISHAVVTKMGLPRLNKLASESHTPFNDFLAEYYFNQIQFQHQKVISHLPTPLYAKKRGLYSPNPVFYSQMRMVENADTLSKILAYNDSVYYGHIKVDTPLLITPLLISVEGAQVLYGENSSKKEYILEPGKTDGAIVEIQKEILANARRLKNLPHRMLFITLGHFAQNHVVGYAKTLDRDPDNFQHRVMATITKIPSIRNKLIRKNYAGFSDLAKEQNHKEKVIVDPDLDSLGFRVVDAFINPDNSHHKKPTYIDVKHMDIKARIQYYYFRRKLESKYQIKIPIIASHFAVSGENQAMAAATGLWPNFDRYLETEDPLTYYKHKSP